MRCNRCGKDLCNCPGSAKKGETRTIPQLQLQPMSDRRKDFRAHNARKAHLRQQAAELGGRGSGRRRRREEDIHGGILSATDAYALLDHLEGLGVNTRASMPKSAPPTPTCTTCGMEALCPHGICLMCSPCATCEAGS